MEQEFISIKEAATVFGVNQITIRRAIRKGFLVAIRIGEGKKSPYRISIRSIDAIHESMLKELASKVRKV